MPLRANPPSCYVDNKTGRLIPNEPMSRNVKRFSEVKKELEATRRNMSFEKPAQCPKWIKTLANVFKRKV